jgi:hypothetical protein
MTPLVSEQFRPEIHSQHQATLKRFGYEFAKAEHPVVSYKKKDAMVR